MGIGRLLRTALRRIVWLLLAWVAVRGVVSLIPAAPAAARGNPAATTSAPDPQAEATRTFAVLFAQDYLTWNAKDVPDHAARLRPYLASGLDEHAGWNPSGARDQQALGAWAMSESKVRDGRYLVNVAVRISQPGPPRIDRTLYLSVPVYVSGRGLTIFDLPAFIPGPDRVDPQGQSYGDPVSDPAPEIRTLAEGFLKAYVDGTDTELSYFVTPGVRLPGLHGLVHWRSLDELKVYRNGNDILAVAAAALQDPQSGSTLHQHFVLKLDKQDRWYVKDLLQKGA